ncbi:MAG: hypothetical protein J0I48_09205 [Devosia sp.]|uniref:hypothetical protein n=1 Tax=Devosia sp. 66-22 TaxID=1895753 RepID=UPI0009259756|nr:hypothetical protein [Devosia sp. 66-22]MBN9346366.1 hypothetical protein [Devosia sp.]OJX52432.1 MAG: hypothetical protein BGO81_09570 [Devosia sp. 66-22]
MAELSDLHRAKRGVAILAACVVQTLGESDPTFERRFLGRLAAAYRELKDNSEGDVIQEMELLAWTRELLTGFDFINGQKEPWLADYKPGDHDH